MLNATSCGAPAGCEVSPWLALTGWLKKEQDIILKKNSLREKRYNQLAEFIFQMLTHSSKMPHFDIVATLISIPF